MNLLLCNFKTDLDDDLLGFTHYWIREFAKHFDNVYVITSEIGRLDLPENVHVFSIGVEKGYSKARRFIEFYKIVIPLLRRVKIDACFVHIAQHFAIMAWTVLFLKRIPIVLWFAHKSTPLTLKIAHWMVDGIVTCTSNAFNLKSNKVTVTGHGIAEDKFKFTPRRKQHPPFNIVSLSRISKIKNIDALIHATALLIKKHGEKAIKLTLIGRIHTKVDIGYIKKVKDLCKNYGIEKNVEFVGAIPNHEIPKRLKKADLTINLCAKGSLDKAVLEAMAVGVPTIIHNESFLDLLEASKANPKHFLVQDLEKETIADAIEYWMKSESSKDQEVLSRLSKETLKEHGLSSTIKKISKILHG